MRESSTYVRTSHAAISRTLGHMDVDDVRGVGSSDLPVWFVDDPLPDPIPAAALGGIGVDASDVRLDVSRRSPCAAPRGAPTCCA